MISMRLSQAAETLQGKFMGKDVKFTGCSTDTRTIGHDNLFIALRGINFDGHSFIGSAKGKGACAALVDNDSSGEMLPLIVINDSNQAMGLLAENWRDNFNLPVLAITGSNGKTTVKEMVTSILGLKASVLSTQGNLNNHIGVPLTLFKLGSEHKYAVIEMGANHAGEIKWLSQIAKPTIALITQCAPAHLEGFETVDGVARAKAEIYSGLCENGIAIINADDKYSQYWKDTASKYKQISFGIKNKADITANEISFDVATCRTSFVINFPEKIISASIPLSGVHNVQNSIAAAACCIAAGIPLLDIVKGLENMEPLDGRMQLINTISGIRILNDTYNANPASLNAGLQVLSSFVGIRWLILGDMRELGKHSEEYHRQAGEQAREYGVQRLYTLGDFSQFAAEGFGNGAFHFSNPEDLISAIKQNVSNELTIMVKGSRSMGMEKIVTSLMEDN